MSKNKGNISGTAKLNLSGLNNVITINHDPYKVLPEHNGKIMRIHLSCLNPDIDFWCENFATIPIDLEEYKKHKKEYRIWLRARVADLGNELIHQMDLKAGISA